jgi:hypothetical protein
LSSGVEEREREREREVAIPNNSEGTSPPWDSRSLCGELRQLTDSQSQLTDYFSPANICVCDRRGLLYMHNVRSTRRLVIRPINSLTVGRQKTRCGSGIGIQQRGGVGQFPELSGRSLRRRTPRSHNFTGKWKQFVAVWDCALRGAACDRSLRSKLPLRVSNRIMIG